MFTSKGIKVTALALVAATSMTLSAPAIADGRHHRGGWGWSDRPHHGGGYNRGYARGYRNGHHDRGSDDALAAVAIVGGVILGAALLSSAAQSQPQTVYAPPPDYDAGYGSSYGYDQRPVQAVPTSEIYRAESGQYCREYESSANIGGRMTYGYGTACQQPDGSWRVVN